MKTPLRTLCIILVVLLQKHRAMIKNFLRQWYLYVTEGLLSSDPLSTPEEIEIIRKRRLCIDKDEHGIKQNISDFTIRVVLFMNLEICKNGGCYARGKKATDTRTT